MNDIIATKNSIDILINSLHSSKTNYTQQHEVLKSAWLESPLGSMLTVSDDEGLYLLEFIERRGLEKEIERLRIKLKATIIPGRTAHIDSITQELKEYFAGSLKEFKTPIHFLGSPFQKMAWKALMNIPYGTTKSYMEQATSVDCSKGFRAVANANGANQLAIIVPCHRVINSNGNLGGYAAGLARKKWLIEHEKRTEKITA